jgi:ABC-type uncharacterized transport system auxiliary subunit
MRTGRSHGWRPVAVLLAAVAMMLAGGCLSGSARPDRFYRLEVPDAATRLELPPLSGRLLVDSIRGVGMMLERPMLYRETDDPLRVRRDGYDQWVAPPPLMIHRALVEFLRSANLAEVVITPEMRLEADFRLAGRVNRFERLLGESPPRASVEVEFNLVRLDDRELLLLETYREEEDAPEDDFGSSAEAFSRALHRILERLALDLREL